MNTDPNIWYGVVYQPENSTTLVMDKFYNLEDARNAAKTLPGAQISKFEDLISPDRFHREVDNG